MSIGTYKPNFEEPMKGLERPEDGTRRRHEESSPRRYKDDMTRAFGKGYGPKDGHMVTNVTAPLLFDAVGLCAAIRGVLACWELESRKFTFNDTKTEFRSLGA
jgi:hypothetical protein